MNQYTEQLITILKSRYASPTLIDTVRREMTALDSRADLPRLANLLMASRDPRAVIGFATTRALLGGRQ